MGKVILTVDDSRTMRDMLKMALRDGGHEVIQADDGVHGTEVLAQNGNIDIIITDINMPLMDGLKLVRRIRADPNHAAVPVVIISTEGASEDRERAMALGATTYINKPIQAPQLIETVKQLLHIG